MNLSCAYSRFHFNTYCSHVRAALLPLLLGASLVIGAPSIQAQEKQKKVKHKPSPESGEKSGGEITEAEIEELLLRLVISSDTTSKAREILFGGLQQFSANRVPDSGNLKESAVAHAQVAQFLSEPLVASTRKFDDVSSHLGQGPSVALGAVQLERLKDRVGMVELGLQLARWGSENEKLNLVKLFQILLAKQTDLASALSAFRPGTDTASAASRTSSPQSGIPANAGNLPETPRNTPIPGNDLIIGPTDLGNGFAGAGGTFTVVSKMDRSLLYATYDRLQPSQILGWEQSTEQKLRYIAQTCEDTLREVSLVQQLQLNPTVTFYKRDPKTYGNALKQIATAESVIQGGNRDLEDTIRNSNQSASRLRRATEDYVAGNRLASALPAGSASDNTWTEAMRRMEKAGVFDEADREAEAAAQKAASQQGSKGFHLSMGARRKLNLSAPWWLVDSYLSRSSPPSGPQIIFVANSTSDRIQKWEDLMDSTIVAIRTGPADRALRLSEQAATLRPESWQGFFLCFLTAEHLKRWSSAVHYLHEALSRGFSPDVLPSSVCLLLDQMEGLDSMDHSVHELLSQLGDAVRQGTCKAQNVAGLLQQRSETLRAEEQLISNLIATRTTEAKNTLMIHEIAPMIQAWGDSDFQTSPLKASLLRKLAARGCRLLAVPGMQGGWTRANRQDELNAWAKGGRDSGWKLAWVADLAAQHDPEGHALLREAAFRWRAAPAHRKAGPHHTQVLEVLGKMAGETALALEAPPQVLQSWQIRRRDTIRQAITGELKGAPNSFTLWSALAEHGWIEMPPHFEGQHQSYCVQTALYLANDFAAPDACGAALLSLKQKLNLSDSDQEWIRSNIGSTSGL